ncbi:MAG TPA: sigma-70 family RNA polymerase sigma factor [Verrucomicrobiae bacterium]
MRPSGSIVGADPSRSTTDPSTSQVTHLLDALEGGDNQAADKLLDLVYSELRRLAAQKLAGERAGHTLQPTALVHEAWLRLNCGQGAHFANRAHFFAVAAEAMRRILIDRARRRLAAKRGLGANPVDLDIIEIPAPAGGDDMLLQLNEAFEKFAGLHPRKAEVVKLRYFVGMTFEETAAALGIAVPTAKKWWTYARAWLRVEMG